VTINGIPAPIFAIANVNGEEQINLQVPVEIAGQPTATIAINTPGNSGTTFKVGVVSAQPQIFAVDGKNVLALHADGVSLVTSAAPAARGETIIFYSTGLGLLNPPLLTNQAGPSTPLTSVSLGCAVTIGNAPSAVAFCGAAPGLIGLYQVNVSVPTDSPSGAAKLLLSVGSYSSKPLNIAIQ
jgi:uncharacterized protein (TIGR03437 family)